MFKGETTQRNEHIGDGVLIFLKKGMANKQTMRLPKKSYAKSKNYATL